MKPRIRVSNFPPERLHSSVKKLDSRFDDTDPHPLLVPVFSALTGLSIFFALMLFEVTLLSNWI